MQLLRTHRAVNVTAWLNVLRASVHCWSSSAGYFDWQVLSRGLRCASKSWPFVNDIERVLSICCSWWVSLMPVGSVDTLRGSKNSTAKKTSKHKDIDPLLYHCVGSVGSYKCTHFRKLRDTEWRPLGWARDGPRCALTGGYRQQDIASQSHYLRLSTNQYAFISQTSPWHRDRQRDRKDRENCLKIKNT